MLQSRNVFTVTIYKREQLFYNHVMYCVFLYENMIDEAFGWKYWTDIKQWYSKMFDLEWGNPSSKDFRIIITHIVLNKNSKRCLSQNAIIKSLQILSQFKCRKLCTMCNLLLKLCTMYNLLLKLCTMCNLLLKLCTIYNLLFSVLYSTYFILNKR
jgi:hypothetical protein